jgi:hypothetical protein
MLLSRYLADEDLQTFFGGLLDGVPRYQRLRQNFWISTVDLDRLKALSTAASALGIQSLRSPETAAIVTLLMAMLDFYRQDLTVLRSGFAYSYVLGKRATFDKVIDKSLAEGRNARAILSDAYEFANGAEVIDAVAQVRGSTWPLRPASPIRVEDDVIVVDLFFASEALAHGLNYPRVGGPMAKPRSQEFQWNVRDLIKGSRWKPDARLESYEGRQLKAGPGRWITDLDAVGRRGATLLAVDCLSIPYTDAYERGDKRELASVESAVREKVMEWPGKVDRLLAHKHGRYHDFAWVEDVIPLVVVPLPPYTTYAASLTQIRPGLYAAASYGELSRWLRSHGA